MGRAFERLVQLYLQTEPEYRTILRHVWTLREVPAQVRKRLALPHPDEGIDLIACTRHGEYWAIQSKFRSQRDQPLTRTELGTFTSLAFNTCRNIALAVVAHTCSRPRDLAPPKGGERPAALTPQRVSPVGGARNCASLPVAYW
jgi:predicted helicase